ncbi:MAG: tetratricopeptide repeat protein [Candidatus Margulisbacteria bacterium]|jgi:Tfp pilus assembly protein PilF|nr:tetratricopeptide repeat protein [Candidatus Margulisiibacteriota bacterium]
MSKKFSCLIVFLLNFALISAAGPVPVQIDLDDALSLAGVSLLDSKADVLKELGAPDETVEQENGVKNLLYADAQGNTLKVQIGGSVFFDAVTVIQYYGENKSPVQNQTLYQLEKEEPGICLLTPRAKLLEIKGAPDAYDSYDRDGNKYEIYDYRNSSYRVNAQGVVDSIYIDLPYSLVAAEMYKKLSEDETIEKFSDYEICLFIAERAKVFQEYAVAKAYYERAFKYEKAWGDEINYANTLKEMGDYTQALNIYQDIQTRVSYNEILEYNLGLAYYQAGQQDNAEKQLKKLTEQKNLPLELKVSALRLLGNIYDDRREPKTALSYYQKALALDDKDATLLFDLGIYYKGQKKFSEARQYLQKALAVNSRYYKAKRELEALR